MPGGFKKQPTVWPNGFYYINRLFQFLASLGVIATMAYFIFNLLRDRFGVPYEFILLCVVAVASLVNIIGSTVAKCCGALNPKAAFGLDLLSLTGWAVAFGLLTRGMGTMILGSCNAGAWGEGNGVWVCKVYKAGWAFALIALIFFVFSNILDLFVIFKSASSQKYVPANPKSMQQTKQYVQPDYSQNTSYGSNGTYGSGGLQ